MESFKETKFYQELSEKQKAIFEGLSPKRQAVFKKKVEIFKKDREVITSEAKAKRKADAHFKIQLGGLVMKYFSEKSIVEVETILQMLQTRVPEAFTVKPSFDNSEPEEQRAVIIDEIDELNKY